MPFHVSLSLPAVVVAGLLLAAAVHARQPLAVRESELRRQIVDSFCTGDSYEGQPERWLGFGSMGCPKAARETKLQRAVLRAFDEARSVLVSIESEALARARQLESHELRRIAYAEALLSDAASSRALWLALHSALERSGHACIDCREPASPAVREIRWQEFEPYVAAYAWPDPVVTPRSSDGRVLGKASYSLHVCLGLNGLQTLQRHDPQLARVAFVAAFDGKLGELVVPLFRALVRELRKRPELSDEEQTASLRTHMRDEVARSARIRRAMCRAVARRAPVFGVRVTDC